MEAIPSQLRRFTSKAFTGPSKAQENNNGPGTNISPGLGD